MRRCLVLLLSSQVACDGTPADGTPPEITQLADDRLPQVRAFAERVRSTCTSEPPFEVRDWARLDEDQAVLNATAFCRPTDMPEGGIAGSPLRPRPEPSVVGKDYPIGVNKFSKRENGLLEPDLLETATKPSELSTEADAVDLCVRTGPPDAADYTSVCVAYKAPPE